MTRGLLGRSIRRERSRSTFASGRAVGTGLTASTSPTTTTTAATLAAFARLAGRRSARGLAFTRASVGCVGSFAFLRLVAFVVAGVIALDALGSRSTDRRTGGGVARLAGALATPTSTATPTTLAWLAFRSGSLGPK